MGAQKLGQPHFPLQWFKKTYQKKVIAYDKNKIKTRHFNIN
jgi:hypothetical protein